ncbi:cytochrome c3 family protein [Kineobactrum sediminis]|nr:cytochrome c3 family protein [Kineobactrum sediminis]
MQIRSALLALALIILSGSQAHASESGYAGMDTCRSCHQFGDDSPVHTLLESAHGNADNPDTPVAQRGCEECHGPSADHTRSPTQVAPAISFGPRWSATVESQNDQCLACHGDNTASHWDNAHHKQQGLACATCHDIHTTADTVLSADSQAEVCTGCHKAQESGIHGLASLADSNPPCTSCHNPHNSRTPHSIMVDNRSRGCATCHNLVAMASDPQVSARATSYHKVMVQDDKTCVSCHVGIAHVSAAGVPPLIPQAQQSSSVTLFYPGQSDSEWLLSEHAGSQSLRQDRSCQQCHRGDEEEMGASLATGKLKPATRDVEIGFQRSGQELLVTLSWRGSLQDRDIALMWGDDRNEAFRQAGCFAACHDDMPGMTRDRGQQLDKYLLVSRLQDRQIGRPAIIRDEAALAELKATGKFAEVWRVNLEDTATVETGTLLAGIDWHEDSLVAAEAQFADGRWSVTLLRPLDTRPKGLHFGRGQKLTVGIALHGVDNPGAGHWVSLPMTFAIDGINTDFKADW